MRDRLGPLRHLTQIERDLLRAVALPGSSTEELLEETASAAPLLIRKGLTSVALSIIGRAGELAARDPEVAAARDTLRLTVRQEALLALAVDNAAARFLAALISARIPFLVIKGPAVARFYPEGVLRRYLDLDLIVRPGDFERVIRCGRELGFTVPFSTEAPWPWFNRVCREGVNLHGAGYENVDVHHHLPPWVFGAKLTFDALRKAATPSQVAGVPVLLVAPEDSLVISALHIFADAWKGGGAAIAWFDIVILADAVGDMEAITDAFSRAGLAWYLRDLALVLNPLVGRCVLPEPAVKAPPFTALRVRAFGWSVDSRVQRHRFSWVVRLPAPRGLAYLAGSFVPSRRWVRPRHRTYRAYWAEIGRGIAVAMRGGDFRALPLSPESHKSEQFPS